MEFEGTRGAVDAVLRWLTAGQNVLVRGDAGSGRTAVLEATLAAASHRNVSGLLLRAGGSTPYAPLLGHPSASSREPAQSEAALAEWLAGELPGPRAVLLVDDVDLVDEGTAAVVLQVVRRTGCALVLSSARDLSRPGAPQLSALMAQCAPAEVRLLPLGFTAMTGLLSSALGAAPDVALVSAVTARSAGNPRVAVALARAARFAGAVEMVDGLWAKVRPLDDAPLDAVAHALLARLADDAVRALELVAWLGSISGTDANRLLGDAVVHDLVAHGRLLPYRLGDEPESLVVSPPALASALRQRLGRRDVAALADRLATAAVAAGQAPDEGAGAPDRLVVTEREPREGDYWRMSAELVALLHHRSANEEAAARSAWEATRGAGRAVAYLGCLMRRPADEEIARVLCETRPAPDDGAQDLVHLRMLEARWAFWRGETVDQVRTRLGEDAAELRPFLEVDGLRDDVVRSLQDGASDADVLRPVDERGLPRFLRGWSVVARAAATLEAGRPDLTLEVCDQIGPGELLPELHHHLDGFRGEALLMLGELRDAETWARVRLEAAYDALDTVGIRVHACVLAQVLLFAGQPQAAWRVLSTAVRLGPAGPLESTYYRRALVLGAALQGRAGALPVARILLAELDAAPRSRSPLVRSLRVLAHAALEVALDREQDASEQMWQRGSRFADRGRMQPALLCWLLSSVPMSAEQLSTVRAAYARTPLPLLAPYLHLHEALAAGDARAVGAALGAGRLWIPAGLTRTAVAVVDESRSVAVEVGSDVPPAAPGRPAREAGGSLALRVQVLSEREREVAVLARAGLTNRQIADQLVLSVRTVENHMSSVLRKLGFSSRGELDRWTEA